jgi:hypothetical protein
MDKSAFFRMKKEQQSKKLLELRDSRNVSAGLQAVRDARRSNILPSTPPRTLPPEAAATQRVQQDRIRAQGDLAQPQKVNYVYQRPAHAEPMVLRSPVNKAGYYASVIGTDLYKKKGKPVSRVDKVNRMLW